MLGLRSQIGGGHNLLQKLPKHCRRSQINFPVYSGSATVITNIDCDNFKDCFTNVRGIGACEEEAVPGFVALPCWRCLPLLMLMEQSSLKVCRCMKWGHERSEGDVRSWEVRNIRGQQVKLVHARSACNVERDSSACEVESRSAGEMCS